MCDHLYKTPRICQSKHYDWKLPYATETAFAGNHSTDPICGNEVEVRMN